MREQNFFFLLMLCGGLTAYHASGGLKAGQAPGLALLVVGLTCAMLMLRPVRTILGHVAAAFFLVVPTLMVLAVSKMLGQKIDDI